MSVAIPGKNTSVKVAWEDPVGTPVSITLGEVIEIGAMDLTPGVIDVTHHSVSMYRDVITGLFPMVEYTLEVNYETVEYEKLFGVVQDDIPAVIEVVYPNLSKHVFPVTTTKISLNTPLETQMTYSFTSVITGTIVYTPV